MELTFDEIKERSVEYFENADKIAKALNDLEMAHKKAVDELESVYYAIRDKLYENYKCTCPICGHLINASLFHYTESHVCSHCKSIKAYPAIVAHIKERYKRDDIDVVSFALRGNLYWIGIKFSNDCEVYGFTLQVKDFETFGNSSGPCD